MVAHPQEEEKAKHGAAQRSVFRVPGRCLEPELNCLVQREAISLLGPHFLALQAGGVAPQEGPMSLLV